MAASFIQSAGAQNSTGSSVNVTLTGVAAGNHLTICTAAFNSTSTTTTPTSTPTASWSSAIAQISDGDLNDRMRVDYSENVAAGSWTVTGNLSAGTAVSAIVIESTGVKTSLSKGVTNHNNTAASQTVTALTTGSVTPTAGSILLAFTTDSSAAIAQDTIDNAFTATPAGGAGTVWDSVATRVGGAYNNNVAALAVNPTFTLPGGTTASAMNNAIVEFLAAPAGGVQYFPTMTLIGVGP